MLRKLALAVIAPALLLLASGSIQPAHAEHHHRFGVYFGAPVYSYPYYSYPYYYYGSPYYYNYGYPYYGGWGWGHGYYGHHGHHEHHGHHH
jgi:hypothetical protein